MTASSRDQALARLGMDGSNANLRMPFRQASGRKIPILLLRRFDRIALAGKSLGGLEGLLSTHPLRGRTPAGIVVEGEPPHERGVF
jgi:hypothetical protein